MKHRWLWAWLAQVAIALAAALLASLSRPLGSIPYGLMMWGLVPLAGMLTACSCVRRGLNNYLAWLAPAPCLYAAHYLLWRFAPPAGAALLAAFVSIVGAAAGLELNRRNGRK